MSGCAAATDVVGESEEPVRVAVFRWADMAPIAEACKPLMDNIVEVSEGTHRHNMFCVYSDPHSPATACGFPSLLPSHRLVELCKV